MEFLLPCDFNWRPQLGTIANKNPHKLKREMVALAEHDNGSRFNTKVNKLMETTFRRKGLGGQG